ncbi:MAG: 5-formyltetrahydrofolate cyclo-ligase, partial [Verrucomicrobiota bacterium]
EQLQTIFKTLPKDSAAASSQICLRLAHEKLFKDAKTILFFAPHSNEPDIWPLLSAALNANKIIALPKFIAAKNHYVASRVENLERDFVPGQFGIREPRADGEEIPLKQLDLALVPGVGFDLVGGRLGRGKGFYDQLLAQFPGVKCGVCFDEQIVGAIPTEPHDVRMDYILTPTRWLKTTGARFE